MSNNTEATITDAPCDNAAPEASGRATDACDTSAPQNGSVLTLELSPIEQRAPRSYNRIAVVLPWKRQDPIIGIQLEEVFRFVRKALRDTLQRWPFLGGQLQPSSDDPDIIELRYSKTLDEQQFLRLVGLQMPSGNWAPFTDYIYHLPLSNFDRRRFVWQHDPQDGDRFPPITVKISVADDALVLGFAFSCIVFDGEAIQNFFAVFFASTESARPPMPEADCRSIPDPIEDQPNLNLFPCYDWSSDTIQDPTSLERLRTHIVTFAPEAVRLIYQELADIRYNNNEDGVVLYEDCILTFMWALIMRARCKNNKLAIGDMCRVNYLVPGSYHTRIPRSNDPEYCGNATGTAVAKCDIAELLQIPNNNLDLLPDHVRLEGVSHGAQLLRHALQSFDARHVHHLSAIKQTIDATRESNAYERALKRHTTSLVFEDWTCYGGGCVAHIPDVKEPRHPYFFPCNDTIQEGNVILLPRKGEYLGSRSWNVYLCLDKEDMDNLIDELDHEHWLEPDDDEDIDMDEDIDVDEDSEPY